jgi:hypothetical protein
MKRLIDFAACTWPDILLRAGEPVNPLPARVRDLRIRSSAAATLDLRGVEEVFNLLEINDCPNLVEILCLPALVECTWILNCPALKRISAWGSTRTLRIGYCESLSHLPEFDHETESIQLHHTGLRFLPPLKGYCGYRRHQLIELSNNPALLFDSPPGDLKAHWETFWTCQAWMPVLKEELMMVAWAPVRVARLLDLGSADDL